MELAVFGSAVRGDMCSDSDVDILVEFEAGTHPGLRFFDLTWPTCAWRWTTFASLRVSPHSRILRRNLLMATPRKQGVHDYHLLIRIASICYALKRTRRIPAVSVLCGRAGLV